MSEPGNRPAPTAPRSPRYVRGSHCGTCGAPYRALPSADTWPRTCTRCGTTAYRNPLPVAVALLPVTGPGPTGLVVITRTIEPQKGGTALPGGFVDHAEDWRHAVVRELREETGIEATEEDVRLADALSDTAGHLLLFGLLPPRPLAALPPSAPTKETSGYEILSAPRTLAFPLHTQAANAWFAGRYG
ncbi:NUDIX domain-containing protein [Streptomyces sp. C11-1]|uniref:NUDIX domain-containing protein n=1 Tax=Streptomyces durocortorensis TaxID=2811104 RepID=A0ABY9VQ55_9ACTN|nr:NUDIX domain-containing protein [Streptomyces durocortorensis]WNF25908.1 NUDIX domain-containing protein [Streptomyces durocortorensis]